ncbi:hypothetical protein AYO38_09745 [bacterium SCGC AG-212-C10]|nr:hypothetical protein AYO38_09745 [bacterium SCGC AG-212-C10]
MSGKTLVSGRKVRLAAGLAGLAATVAAPFSTAFADTHEVRSGDTLSEIAETYGVPIAGLVELNGLNDADQIYIGQQLAIWSRPAVAAAGNAGGYRVSEGDTLSSIAEEFGLTIQELVDANGLDDADAIYIGEALIIPPRSYVAAAPPTPRWQVEAALRAAAAEFGVSQPLVLALAWQESGWQQGVVSSAGAVGVMQVIPSTAAWALEELVPNATNWETSVHDNTRVGVAVLSHLIDQAGGDLDLALAFYYQGWYNVERFGYFDSTQAYIDNVKALRAEFQ